VRKRCGFGCVLCGDAIVEYEHFDPPFLEATAHLPLGITLLCGSHHNESTKGLLSKEMVKQADRKPACKAGNPPRHLLNLCGSPPRIVVAGNDMSACGGKILVGGETLFEISPPERGSHVWRLSASLKDEEGKRICFIRHNEMKFDPECGDIVQEASRFEVRDRKGRTILKLTSQPRFGISLDHFEIPMAGGRCLIGLRDVPSFEDRSKFEKRPAIAFESSNGVQVFMGSTFASPTGLRLNLVDGGLRIGGN